MGAVVQLSFGRVAPGSLGEHTGSPDTSGRISALVRRVRPNSGSGAENTVN